MSHYLAQTIIIASNSEGEETFWTQMLVLVVLAALFGISSLVKTRSNKLRALKEGHTADEDEQHGWQRWPNKAFTALKEKSIGISLKTSQLKAISRERVFASNAAGTTIREKSKIIRTEGKDLGSGMEVLELDFLVDIVENTESRDQNDVTMRKLSFNELLRRKQLKAADSKALRDYALNEDDIYGKNIQCEAIRELAKRTGTKTQTAAQVRDLVAV
ncbi:MAG: hypothetical protein JSW23_08720 [Planctomycetota bacterium]|nr:MAG: hypothetical protein JSW23_08720 [Planctomycetota bacterium]